MGQPIVHACPCLYLLDPACLCLVPEYVGIIGTQPALPLLPDLACHTQDLIGQEEVYEDDDHLNHLKDPHHLMRVGEVPGPAVAASGVKYCPLVSEKLGDLTQCGQDQEFGRKKFQ